MLGVYIWSWSGQSCGAEGQPLAECKQFLQNMFIAQLCLNGVYLCCSNLISGPTASAKMTVRR